MLCPKYEGAHMKWHVKIDKYYTFKTETKVYFAPDVEPDYQVYPKSQGVYIFHQGLLKKIWKDKENILYIGAANREPLRSRIKKNWQAKISTLVNDEQVGIYLVYVSYCVLNPETQDYIPFLIEGTLLDKYWNKFNKLPCANYGRR